MYRGFSSSRRSVAALCALAATSLTIAFAVPGSAGARDEVCSSGAHTLSESGDHVYPEMGNGGYRSVHTDVNLVYDAARNEFLAGNGVVLTDLATQCLTDFSLDFARHTPDGVEERGGQTIVHPGADMTVQAVTLKVEGADVPATFEFVQPTYPGDPNGQNDPDPAAHESGQDTPVSATNPLPPACSPQGEEEADNGLPCPANKLVVVPATPIPSGASFEVKVEYTGRPGVYTDGDGSIEGWFQSDNPAGDGSFVTTEPVGSEAWMPLNNHPTAKPTYDFTERVSAGRTAIANGELVKTAGGANFEEDPNDPQFPAGGSWTWRWHSPEPIASYLVESSVGNFELNERVGADGITYYEAQASAITPAQKATNKALIEKQEDITHFQERFNGHFPFTTDGVVVGFPPASFQEEMQGKITFNNGRVSSASTLNHENFHQWWGDSVSESSFNETFFKEGMAKLSEYLLTAREAAEKAGGLDTPAGDAAFDASLVARFRTNYAKSSLWLRAPSNPTPASLFASNVTYERTATAYIALRQILGKDRFVDVLKQIQAEFGGSSISESQLEAVFGQHLTNQSPAARTRLNQFFAEWFDTAFPATGPATALKPQLTGPGLERSAAGATFFPVTSARIVPNPVGNTVTGPATVALAAADPAGVTGTEYSLDGGAFQPYEGPVQVSVLGDHTIEYRSTNREGAVEQPNTLSFAAAAHDAPVTTARVLPEPVGGQVVGPATVVLSASENGGGVESTEYSLDGAPFQAYAGPFTVTGFAQHTVEYRSTNRDGVVEQAKQLSFTVVPHDSPVTTATILPAPVAGKVIGPASIVLSAADAGIDLTGTEFKLDNGAFQPYAGPISVSALGDHAIEYRSTNSEGTVEAAKRVTFTVLAPPAPKPVCETPQLTVAVSHPLRRARGAVTLLRGRAYRYTGRLTCGAAATPAPAGTVVQVLNQVGRGTKAQGGVVVGEGGKIDTLLQYASRRTVVFRFSEAGATAEAKIRIAVAHR